MFDVLTVHQYWGWKSTAGHLKWAQGDGSASSHNSNGGYNTQGTGQETRYTEKLDNS